MDYIKYWSDGKQLGGGVRYCMDLSTPRMKRALLMDLATLEHTRVDWFEVDKYGTAVPLDKKDARRILLRLNEKERARKAGNVSYRKDYVEKVRQWLKTKARGQVLRNRELPKGSMDEKESYSQLPA